MSNQLDIAIFGVVSQKPLRALASAFRWKIDSSPVLICRQDHAETVRILTDTLCQTATGLLAGNSNSLSFLTSCLDLGDPVYVLRTKSGQNVDATMTSYFPPTYVSFSQLTASSMYPIEKVLCVSRMPEQEIPKWAAPL